MTAHRIEARWRAIGDPLPRSLVALTLATGLVDAVSFLGLGQVFVANQTGNVVFLAFALAGASGLSARAAARGAARRVGGGHVRRRDRRSRAGRPRPPTPAMILLTAVVLATAAGYAVRPEPEAPRRAA